MTMLFSNIQRTSFDPSLYAEPDYDYLDRSARPEAARVRKLLEDAFSDLPDKEKPEIKARIQSGDSRHFESATFELLLFALCRSLGFQVTIHPELPGKATAKLDFLLRDPSGEEFYLEAVLASDASDKERAAEASKKVFLDSINKVKSPNFYLGIDSEGDTASPPSGKRLRTDIEKWLSSLNPDEVLHDLLSKGRESLPKLEWNHGGWKVRFEAIPKSPERRGVSTRIIGVISPEAQSLSTWRSMRDAVTFKGNKYGDLDKPLLIAINVQSQGLDRIDEMQALFGEEEYVFDPRNLEGQSTMRRKPNGAWYEPKGPRYKRVSGVWLFNSINPWNVAKRKATIYLNLWAHKALPESVLVLPYARAEENKMVWHEGKSLGEVLCLDRNWPE